MLQQLQRGWTAEATCQSKSALEGGVQHAMEFTLQMTCRQPRIERRSGSSKCDSDPDGLFGFVDETWTPRIGKSSMFEFQPPYLAAASRCNAVFNSCTMLYHLVPMNAWKWPYASHLKTHANTIPLRAPCSRRAWGSTLGSNSCQGLTSPRRIQHCCWALVSFQSLC